MTNPSGAPGLVHDLLAKGLAELGHTVFYLLEKGYAEPLPHGVFPVSSAIPDVDIYHNVESQELPWVTTQHGYYGDEPPYPTRHTIFVSQALARAYDFDRAVWNGIDPEHYDYTSDKSDYFVFLAAMQGPTDKDKYNRKGIDVALGLCKKAGLRLIVAGTAVESAVVDQIQAVCQQAGATYVGDVRGQDKAKLLAGARGLLFPTQIVEGFGLVMVEALMSGTPVICSNLGACPELISDDVGFVCNTEADYLHAVAKIETISPQRCRAFALERYHYHQMCTSYVREYEREITRHNALQHA